MQVGGSGGGYFYGPFVSTQEFREYQMVPDPLGAVYGAWNHLAVPILTGRGRWLEMSVC
jgi:hypothetical protein